MKDFGDIGTVLAYLGFIILAYGTLKYGNDILRGNVGRDSVFIGAAGCTGLTGATLTACQKAQIKPKPKPVGITAAKPKPVGITAAPKRPLIKSRFQNLKRPVRNPYAISPADPRKRCNDLNGSWRDGKCYYPIRPNNPHIVRYNNCVSAARRYYLSKLTESLRSIAAQCGYTVAQLQNNTALSCGNQFHLQQARYAAVIRDADNQCMRKFLGIDMDKIANREMTPTVGSQSAV